jgi:hypothetical protein
MSTTTFRRFAGMAFAAATAATLTACGNASDAGDGPELPEVQSEAEANAAADASAEATPAGPKTNERGNIVKALGEEGAVLGATGGKQITFAVDSVASDATCTEDYASAPENGHITVVQLRVATSPEVTSDSYTTVGSGDFRFIGADGITFDDVDTIATYGCMDSATEFTQDPLGPSQMYAGQIVLDLPASTGTLIFAPYWGQSGGWEYTF